MPLVVIFGPVAVEEKAESLIAAPPVLKPVAEANL